MKDHATTFGIDHMAFYSPSRYLSLEELALVRKVSPSKYTVGIGIQETAIATPAEDVVVLAANAGERVLREAGVSPREIGLLIVGTESAEDKSKPTATHVHDLLGINNACRVYDIIHACAGATYGVLSAMDWLQNPAHKYALVISSDIARYGRASAGEPTQGAGAVAMLISRSPRLIALTELATFSKNVYDFWKPLDHKFPVVDGVYSAQCYIEAAVACFQGQSLSRNAAYCYHVPYPKLVKQAHARICPMIGKELDGMQHFEDYVAGSCVYPSRIGNIYTGSLWLSLMSVLSQHGSKQEQRRSLCETYDGCYLFSYGSGCGAALMRGRFGTSAEERVSHFRLDELLSGRTRIGVEEYEMLMEAYEHPDSMAEEKMNQIPVSGKFRYLGTKNNKRAYGPNPVVAK